MDQLGKCGRMTNCEEIDKRIIKIKENIKQNKNRLRQKYKESGFEFKPFSIKQKKVLTWWCADYVIKLCSLGYD